MSKYISNYPRTNGGRWPLMECVSDLRKRDWGLLALGAAE